LWPAEMITLGRRQISIRDITALRDAAPSLEP